MLTVSVSPNFASKWLVSRIGKFSELFPDIDLRISSSLQHVDFAREDVDVAVRHGEEGKWPDLQVVGLTGETLFPMCSPMLMEGEFPLSKRENLARHTLLHLDNRELTSGSAPQAAQVGICKTISWAFKIEFVFI